MARRHKVLLIGSSGVTFSESGPADTLAGLLERELTRRAPEAEWECLCFEASPTRNMADVVSATVEREAGDVVLLAPASSYFTYEYVVVRLRRISPRLYARTVAWTTWLKRMAGGGLEGSASPRGWLFRAPRWVGARVLGMEPRMKVEYAIENTTAALRWLVKQESVVTLVKLPTTSFELAGPRASVYLGRLNQFNDALHATCREHHVPCYELREAIGEAGAEARKGSDGSHWPIEVRRWDAGYLAGLVIEQLQLDNRQALMPSRRA